jgi:hypothetical protein
MSDATVHGSRHPDLGERSSVVRAQAAPRWCIVVGALGVSPGRAVETVPGT